MSKKPPNDLEEFGLVEKPTAVLDTPQNRESHVWTMEGWKPARAPGTPPKQVQFGYDGRLLTADDIAALERGGVPSPTVKLEGRGYAPGDRLPRAPVADILSADDIRVLSRGSDAVAAGNRLHSDMEAAAPQDDGFESMRRIVEQASGMPITDDQKRMIERILRLKKGGR